MGYKTAELRLGKNDTPLDDPRDGEVALRIDSAGAIYTKPEGAGEVAVPTADSLSTQFGPLFPQQEYISASYATLLEDASKELMAQQGSTITLADGMPNGYRVTINRLTASVITVVPETVLWKLVAGSGYVSVVSATVETSATVIHMGANYWLIRGDIA